MELRYLSAFNAVAEELHFGRAAQRLFLSQSAISRLIRQLEAELGVILLDRSTHHVALTSAGKQFLERSRAALKEVDLAVRIARSSDAGQKGTLKVGYVSSTEAVLARQIGAFRGKRPDVEIALYELSGSTLADPLRLDELDLAMSRVPVDNDRTSCEVILEEPLVAVIPSSHVGAGDDDPLELEVITDGSTVLMPTALFPQAASALARRCRERNVPLMLKEVPSFAAAQVLVASRMGMTFIPLSCATNTLPGVECRSLSYPIVVHAYALWHVGKRLEAVDTFIRTLQTAEVKDGFPIAGETRSF